MLLVDKVDIDKKPNKLRIIRITGADPNEFESIIKTAFEQVGTDFNILSTNYCTYLSQRNTEKWSAIIFLELL